MNVHLITDTHGNQQPQTNEETKESESLPTVAKNKYEI